MKSVDIAFRMSNNLNNHKKNYILTFEIFFSVAVCNVSDLRYNY